MSNDGLISRKALLYGFDVRKVTEYDESGCGVDYKAVPVEAIENAPTVDAEPVRHGKWRQTGFRHGKIDLWPLSYECSECNRILFGSPKTNFCPNCGAKMDKEKKT